MPQSHTLVLIYFINGWNKHIHYCNLGGQCGQSCPCCRAEIYLKCIDEMLNVRISVYYYLFKKCQKHTKNKNKYK